MNDLEFLGRDVVGACRLVGEFRLRSGQVSDVYFDKYQLSACPRLFRHVTNRLAGLVPGNAEAVAGLALGGVPLASAVAGLHGLPCAFFRKRRKEYGTCRYAEGIDLNGKNFVLVEDVVTTGGAVVQALEMLKADNLKPSKVICVIDRESGGREAIEAYGVEFEPLFTMAWLDILT